jgi:hypothetical protein
MKNKNSGALQLIIVIAVLGLGIKLCTDKKESTSTFTPSNFVDTASALKDSIVNVKPTFISKETKKSKKKKKLQAQNDVSVNTYTAPIQTTTKRKRSYSSSSSSNGCSSRQCYGSTKKGSRCRNMTTSCNGYCWRHGG